MTRVFKAEMSIAGRFQAMANGPVMDYQLRFIQAGVAAGCTRMELHLDGRCQLVYYGGRFCLETLARGLKEPVSLVRGSPEAYLADGIRASGSPVTYEGSLTLTLAEPPDMALLLRRCQHCPVPIAGDVEIPRRGLPEHHLVDHQDDGYRILVPSSLRGPAMVLWLEAGVLIDTDTLPAACPGARVLAAGQAELSVLGIVRDEVHAQRLREFRARLNQLTRNLLERPLEVPPQADYLVASTLTTVSIASLASVLVPALAPALLVAGLMLGPVAGRCAGQYAREQLQKETQARLRQGLRRGDPSV